MILEIVKTIKTINQKIINEGRPIALIPHILQKRILEHYTLGYMV